MSAVSCVSWAFPVLGKVRKRKPSFRTFRLKQNTARVPFLVRWPGRIAAGEGSDMAMTTPDIAPTILGLLGLEIPGEMEGMNCAEVLLGESEQGPQMALMQNTGACAAWEDGYEWRALRDATFTYATYREPGCEFLFHHREDPWQLRNLIDDPAYAEVVARFRQELKARMEAIRDTFPPSTWYRDHWIEDRVILRTATLD